MRTHRARERGAALVTILMVSSVLLAAGVIMSRVAGTEIRIAANEMRAGQSLALADGGVNHAMGLLLADAADGFDDELAGDGTGGGLASLGTLTSLDGVPYRFRAHQGGPDGYYVRVVDNFDESTAANDPSHDADHQIRVMSEARVGGAIRRVEALVRAVLGPDCALTSEDDLRISGNPQIAGAQGCVHTNGALSVNGNPDIQHAATSSGTMDLTGRPVIDGEVLGDGAAKADYVDRRSQQPRLSLPSVNPLAFGPTAINLAEAVRAANQYRLDDDCRVYQGGSWTCGSAAPFCSGGTQVGSGQGGGWNGWKCTSTGQSVPGAQWKVSGNGAGDGAFFVEGWVDISGGPGSPSVPWRTTIIAMNSIDVSGNPTMVPFTTTGDLRNILLVSGNDVGLKGSFGALLAPSAIFAHQQLVTNGNVTLTGFIVAEGGVSTWANDPAPSDGSGKNLQGGESRVSGNVTIVHQGVDTGLIEPRLELLSWKDIREGSP